MAGSQFFTFCVSLAAMLALAAALYRLELAGQAARRALRELREAARSDDRGEVRRRRVPRRLRRRARLRRDHRAEAAAARARARRAGGARAAARARARAGARRRSRLAELLFWPALLAYGEAAVAYFGEARHPGCRAGSRPGACGIGWLAQTALLVVQAARADGFPWSTLGRLAQPLRLARRRRVPDLGLPAALPAARAARHAARRRAARRLARLGGGTSSATRSDYSNLFLVLHVGLVLAAFAGFTLAAALVRALPLAGAAAEAARGADPPAAARRRSRRSTTLAGRTIAFALPALTLGIVAGLVRLGDHGGGFDALMARDARRPGRSTALPRAPLRRPAGTGARPRTSLLAGFALVIVVRLALPTPTSS